jgi:hypothetical protein
MSRAAAVWLRGQAWCPSAIGLTTSSGCSPGWLTCTNSTAKLRHATSTEPRLRMSACAQGIRNSRLGRRLGLISDLKLVSCGQRQHPGLKPLHTIRPIMVQARALADSSTADQRDYTDNLLASQSPLLSLLCTSIGRCLPTSSALGDGVPNAAAVVESVGAAGP